MQSQYKYLKAVSVQDTPSVNVGSLANFENALATLSPSILIQTHRKWGFIFDGAYYYFEPTTANIDLMTYTSFEEFVDFAKKGFKDYALYKMGYANMYEFVYAAKHYAAPKEDERSVLIFEKYQKSLGWGFPAYNANANDAACLALEEAKRLKKEMDALPHSPSTLDIYTQISNLSIHSLADFVVQLKDTFEAKKLGFNNIEDYQQFKNSNFTDSHAYKDATKKGFLDKLEYDKSLELQLPNKIIFDQFIALQKEVNQGNYSNYNENLLLEIIAKMQEGEQETLQQLQYLFEEQRNVFFAQKDVANLLKSILYKEISDDIQSFTNYIENNEKLALKGAINKKIGFFERKDFFSKHVIVDASNVAWANQDRARGGRPLARNIELMKKELEKKGFLKISFLADANLKMLIDNASIFSKIDIQSVPTKNRADDFLLKKMREAKCFVVSNDTFKQAKERDVWLAQNIDDWRISFLIENNGVILNNKKLDKL